MLRAYALILSLFLSFAPPFAFALSGTDFDAFRHLSNAARTADGGLSANYHFLNTKNVAKVAKNYKVTAKQLARIYKKRRFCVVGGFWTVALCSAVMYMGTDYITDLLIGDGWTVDEKEGQIYKEESQEIPNVEFCYSVHCFPSVDDLVNHLFNQNYSTPVTLTLYPPRTVHNSNPVNTTDIDALKTLVKSKPKPFPDFQYALSFDYTSTTVFVDTSLDNVVSTETYQTMMTVKYDPDYVPAKRLITDNELADYVKKAPDDDVIALATSPDYAAEGHEPTLKAAEVAVPEADAPPDEDPTTEDPTTDPSTDPAEQPAFCDYAKKLCDWLDWTIEEPQPSEREDVDIDDAPQMRDPAEFDKSYIDLPGTCPPAFSFSIDILTIHRTIELPMQPACDFAEAVKPAILFAGAFVAFRTVSASIRGTQ